MSVTTRRGRRRRPESRHQLETGPGAEGNERLTALTGAFLLAGFAAEGMTILQPHRLLTLHFFLGLLLIGPVALKTGSVCYRFTRYYAGAAPYVRKGPPAPLLRVLGPLVILTSVAVLGTGVMLAVTGPGPAPGSSLLLHKASFILWFAVMSIHVLAYAWRVPRILLGTGSPGHGRVAVPGGTARWLLVAGSLAAGLLTALLAIHLVTPWPGGLAFR